MADIKTMTEEVEELELNIVELTSGGEYDKLAELLSKIIEKIDELTTEVNILKNE